MAAMPMKWKQQPEEPPNIAPAIRADDGHLNRRGQTGGHMVIQRSRSFSMVRKPPDAAAGTHQHARG